MPDQSKHTRIMADLYNDDYETLEIAASVYRPSDSEKQEPPTTNYLRVWLGDTASVRSKNKDVAYVVKANAEVFGMTGTDMGK